ncbi:MAG: hypothetical protein H7282_02290 [Cytophagaceae bacterium]|nr:hypothetical protein [Cytophagaceae bacterium]
MSDTVLSDVRVYSIPGINKGDAGIDAVYWSLSIGLVRYDYQQLDNSYISYERQDF